MRTLGKEDRVREVLLVDEWSGCYASNWNGLVVPDAFAHP